MVKTNGYQFYRDTLNSAKFILAPMVEQSELPWRMLSRKYGAELCYTPMMHAGIFSRDPTYRTENFSTCAQDRPLIVQFCTDDPDLFVSAGKLVENDCDAVDLNLGCPQHIARRGHYGSFLQDEWQLIYDILSKGVNSLKVPVTAKIRIFSDIGKSVEYAKMVESSGIALIAVHGRTREQKGPDTGLASWEHLKAIKNALKIPVIANGNILCYNDLIKCMKQTGCDGVMVAETNLYNPALFANVHMNSWDLGLEYLFLTEKYPCSFTCVRAHLFKIFQKVFERHHDLRDKMGKLKIIDEIKLAIEEIKVVVMKSFDEIKNTETASQSQSLSINYWICQAHIRPIVTSELTEERSEINRMVNNIMSELGDVSSSDGLSMKLDEISGSKSLSMLSEKEQHTSILKIAKILERKRRKNERLERKIKYRDSCRQKAAEKNGLAAVVSDVKSCVASGKRVYVYCTKCKNPRGETCEYGMCRKCCRDKVFYEIVSCKGHGLKPKKAVDSDYSKKEETLNLEKDTIPSD